MKLYDCPRCAGRGHVTDTGSKTVHLRGKKHGASGGVKQWCLLCRKTGKVTAAQIEKAAK